MFAKRFADRFADSIIAVLNCFDRVVIKGHLPFGGDGRLNAWVDHELGMRRKDFLPMLQEHSQRLVEDAQAMAEQAGRPYFYRQGKFRKEAFIDRIIREDSLGEGLVAVLCVQETCRTVKLCHGEGRPWLRFAPRPQRVLYFYWMDAEFGLMHVRLQTWFPYTIQVCVNGHDWLARQMSRRGIGFVQRDNAFTELDDPQAAQKLADRFAPWSWIRQLSRWARQVNRHICRGGWLSGMNYYWVTDQAEYATDVLFAGPRELASVYPRLLDHATVNFSAADILTFLGRKLHGNFAGEVLTDCKKQRWPGARVKHRVKNNWLKMYDKFGQVLRIETVIHQPREFRVRRKRVRNGKKQMVWCPMNKGIANLPGYQRVARAANARYLDALSVVKDPTPAYRRVRHLAESKQHRGRRYAGFNPARVDDVRLFEAVLRGDHLLRGFYNADIRTALWGHHRCPAERHRQARRMSRLLKRLHVRGLIAKIPRTRRWRVTTLGLQLLTTVTQLHNHGLSHAA